MAKHSPAPWTRGGVYRHGWDEKYVQINGADGAGVCKLIVPDHRADQLDIDAELIRAAPELLEACENALGVIGLPLHPSDCLKIQDQLHKAISKAKGGES